MQELELLQELERLSTFTRSVNTHASYSVAWKQFREWCDSMGRSFSPATDETVALFLTHLITSGRKVTTAQLRLSAIRYQHRVDGYERPDSKLVRAVLAGARRSLKQQPVPKAAILPDDLRRICSSAVTTPIEIRNRAILLFGFGTALRRAEIARVQVSDVQFAEKGMVVRLRWEKQDQVGKGRQIAVCPTAAPELCAIAATRAWLNVRGSEPGPLFCRLTNGKVALKPFTGRASRIGVIVKQEVTRAGFDPRMYAGHSLRAGFITAAVLSGASELMISRHTGHKCLDVLRRYFRASDLFEGAVSGRLGL